MKKDADYCTTLEIDDVLLARQLAVACRASSQRRDDLGRVIRDGNVQWGLGRIGPAIARCGRTHGHGDSIVIEFLMIDHMLELAPVRF